MADDRKQEKIAEQKPQESEGTLLDGLKRALGEKYDFVEAALSGNASKQALTAAGLGLLSDALADEINDIAAEIMGDIILEDQGGYYTIIEDYREIFEHE